MIILFFFFFHYISGASQMHESFETQTASENEASDEENTPAMLRPDNSQ
jgi:hypothetical protein